MLRRIKEKMTDFPGYANIYRVHNTFDIWNVENGLITPTLKLKRNEICKRYSDIINSFYEGH